MISSPRFLHKGYFAADIGIFAYMIAYKVYHRKISLVNKKIIYFLLLLF